MRWEDDLLEFLVARDRKRDWIQEAADIHWWDQMENEYAKS